MRVFSSISLFVDDFVIYTGIINDFDIYALQADINNVTQWCDDWNTEYNIAKC